jgi:tetratricopeptide (TPR) repeat protein
MAVPAAAVVVCGWEATKGQHPFAWTLAGAVSAGVGVLSNLPPGTDGSVIEVGGVRTVPFHDRTVELREISGGLALSGEAPTGVVAYGEEGAGKTALVREFAYRQVPRRIPLLGARRTLVAYLLNASSSAAARNDLEWLAERLHVPVHARFALTLQGLWRKLAEYDAFLLIYDGVRRAEDLAELRPLSGRGSVLWTTSEPDVPDAVPEFARVNVPRSAAIEAGRLEPVQGNTDAVAVLQLFQWLSPSRVPAALFRPRSTGGLPSPWRSLLADATRLDSAVATLRHSGLLTEHKPSDDLRVAGWTRTRELPGADDDLRLDALEAVLLLLTEAFPVSSADQAVRERCSVLLAHVQEASKLLAGLGERRDDWALRAGELLLRAARYEDSRDLLDEAATDLDRALALVAGVGEDGARPESSLHGGLLEMLATVRFHQSRLADAQALARRAVELQAELSTARADALVVLHLVQRELGEVTDLTAALESLRAAREVYERTLGVNSRKVGECVRHEARLLWRMGRFEEAEPLARQAVDRLEIAAGARHAEVGLALNALGLIERDLGRGEQARSALERALDLLSDSLGDQAQEGTLKAREYLAEVLVMPDSDGRPVDIARAETLIGQVLDARRSFDAAHSNYAMALLVHAKVLRATGEARAALDEAHRSGLIYEARYPETHPYRALAVLEQARAYADLRDYGAARACGQRALDIREAALGSAHPYTAQARGFLEQLP